MSKQRVVALITSHRVRIARALVRQIRSLSSRYATVDPQALEMSLQRLLVAIARFLETGDDTVLRTATMNTAQLRQALGFRVDDFMAAGLSFLPVLRRFLVEQAPSVQVGLNDYETFEAVAIPILAELARMFRYAGVEGSPVDSEFGDISDDEDEDDITMPNRQLAGQLQFAIERVTGADSEESPFS
jgi:hypothetical protein